MKTEERSMRRSRLFWILALILSVTLRGYSDDGGEKEKVAKVTSQTMAGEQAGAAMSGAATEVSPRDDEAAVTDATIEKDLETISREVGGSTIFVVIKVVALAAAVGGLAWWYIPRRRKGGTQ
jgi:cobalamin biosynthesis Mg chelatase CobN